MLIELYDSTLGADAASFDVSSISSSYDHLLVILQGRSTGAFNTVSVACRFNNDSGGNYDSQLDYGNNATPTASATVAQTSAQIGDVPGSTATANHAGALELTIPNYTGTTFQKQGLARSGWIEATSAGGAFAMDAMMNWRSTAAIDRITIFPTSGNFLAGSRLTIYGIKGETNLKISALTALTTLDGTEEIAVSDSGVSKKVTANLLGPTDGWTINPTTLTRTGNFTFTESGDTTKKWQKATRFEYTQSAVVKYGVVASSSHSAGTTTVTLVTNSDYAMAAGSLDNPRYSYQASPQGYPGWFNYTPTWSGTGTPPALGNGNISGSFEIIGKTVHYTASVQAGSTSTYGSGGVYTISLPVPYASFMHGTSWLYNNGVQEFLGIGRGGGTTSDVAPIVQTNSGGISYWQPTSPFTFGNTDYCQVSGTYQF